jgi:hypothetical protein
MVVRGDPVFPHWVAPHQKPWASCRRPSSGLYGPQGRVFLSQVGDTPPDRVSAFLEPERAICRAALSSREESGPPGVSQAAKKGRSGGRSCLGHALGQIA